MVRRALLLGLCVLLTGCVTTQEMREGAPPGAVEKPTPEKLKYDLDQLSLKIQQVQDSIDSLEPQMGTLSQAYQQQASETKSLSEKVQSLERAFREVQADTKARSVASLLNRVQALSRDKRYEEVVALLKPTVGRVDPVETGHDELLYLYAKGLYETQAYEQAAVVAADIESFHPESKWVSDALLVQAQSLEGMGKKEEAKLFFEDLKERFPQSAAAKAVHPPSKPKPTPKSAPSKFAPPAPKKT